LNIKIISLINNLFVYLSSTLWVRAINNGVEECQAAEKSIAADKALFAVKGKHVKDLNMKFNNRFFVYFEDDSKAAVARLILVVQEAHDLVSSINTLERHR
jgi:hypothetical protein